MQAYKHTATVRTDGSLVLHQPLALPAGQTIEIVIWVNTTPVAPVPLPTESQPETRRIVDCDIPILKEWLEQTTPGVEADAKQEKWEYLRSKYNL